MRQYDDYTPGPIPRPDWAGGDWDPEGLYFDPYSGDPFAPNFVGPLTPEQQETLRSRRNNALGVRDLSPQQLFQDGLPGSCGCPGKAGPIDPPVDTRQHAATYIPSAFRLKHHRAKGMHLAMLGNRIVLTFTGKKACASFCRAWNALMSHVGQAEEFLPSDLTQVFSDLIVGGSGTYGQQNEFSPPFRGRIMA